MLQAAGRHIGDRRPVDKRDLRTVTVEESWKDLKPRWPSPGEACRRQEDKDRRPRFFWRIGTVAAAAGVLIAIGIGWLAFRRDRSPQLAPMIAATSNPPPANASAELVTPQGRKSLALGQPVKTEDQPQEVLVGGMHRVVMNRRTEAVFGTSPLLVQDRLAGQVEKVPYEVRLARGELYVEVFPGHPFTVRTDNALLRITGTRFNVRAQPGKTELVLLHGSVCFSGLESPEQYVSVIAGQASTVVGHGVPRAPEPVDALAATAWARDLALGNAIARVGPEADGLLDSICYLGPNPKATCLGSADYKYWLESRRDWFAREFPWIFQAQIFLKERHGIDVDYVELLMVSGDIWQFHYPRSWNQPIPIFNPAAIQRIADSYKVNCLELLKASAPVAESLSVCQGEREALPCDQADTRADDRYLSALRVWHSDVAAAAGTPGGWPDDLLTFTLRAATYLANTRQAACLWIDAHPGRAGVLLEDSQSLNIPSLERSGYRTTNAKEWADALRREALAAQSAAQAAQEMLLAPKAAACEIQTATAKRLQESISLLLSKVPE
jgi:hypothetical protein